MNNFAEMILRSNSAAVSKEQATNKSTPNADHVSPNGATPTTTSTSSPSSVSTANDSLPPSVLLDNDSLPPTVLTGRAAPDSIAPSRTAPSNNASTTETNVSSTAVLNAPLKSATIAPSSSAPSSIAPSEENATSENITASPAEVPPAVPDGGTRTLDQMFADIHEADETPGTSFAKGTTSNSTSYTVKRKKVIDDFLAGLWQQAPKYDIYLQKTKKNVPVFFPAKEVEALFILLSGPEEKRKKIGVLNNMLVDWIACARKKNPPRGSSIYHSPSTLNFMLRSFFAATKSYYNWCFNYGDFDYDGGFNGFFKALCEERRKEDVSILIVKFFFR